MDRNAEAAFRSIFSFSFRRDMVYSEIREIPWDIGDFGDGGKKGRGECKGGLKMFYEEKIWAAESNGEKICILPKMANRHGLIAGATGTGKTITLKVLAESFSDCSVPVFLADVKGDLAGMCCPGEDTEDMKQRIESFGLADCGFSYTKYPVCFWDIGGKRGLPLRTTISEMGPMLLARLLDLTEVQTDILSVVFRIADDDGLLLFDTNDLRSLIQYV